MSGHAETRAYWTTGPGSEKPPQGAFDVTTPETDAEWTERNRREAEEAQAACIEQVRADAHERLARLRDDLRRLDRTVARLGEGDLFDVEFEGTGERVYTAARTQIDVALAAIGGVIPEATS